MAAPAGPARLSYIPKPHEQAYYEGLFAVADTQRMGSIGGSEAVRFLSTSGLPVDVLKPVWTLADQPATNALDKPKFAVAIRLIQLLQNGQKGQGQNLEAPEGVVLRPARFEGVSGVSVPMPPPYPGPGAAGGQPRQAPPQQQQMAPPPPQQRPPPQQQQQQYAQAPPPPRPPQQQQQPQPSFQSMALTAQDPYTLTPSEQSRYESLFPEYAKPDGFVYGSEAVPLFSKSGLPQPLLAAIWNMSDSPVDNRLDKLEFCIAMHMIVCISKKNLPMPPGLPVSLKQLKGQQQQQQPQSFQSSPVSNAQQQPSAPSSPSMYTLPPSAGIPSPIRQPQQFQPPPTTMMGPPPVQQYQTNDSPGMASLPGPPPIQKTGGLDIHDAFEGLVPGEAGTSYSANQPSSFQQQPMGFSGDAYATSSPSMSPQQQPVTPYHSVAEIPEPELAPTMKARTLSPVNVKTTEQLKASYDMGEASVELAKLKVVLQRLQAENISLKATMGTMTEEERDVQKELNAVVSEVGKLSNELTTLRAKVLAAKSRLLEATAELKACHEKKTVIKDLIAEASATKDALDDAYQGIEKANEAARAPPAAAPAPESSFGGDFFSFGAAPPNDLSQSPGAAQPQDLSQTHVPSFGAEPSHDMYKPTASNGSDGPFVYHERIDSGGSGYMLGEGIMGGAPTPLPVDTDSAYSESLFSGDQPPPSGSGPIGGPSPTMESIAALKQKLKEAESVARDADESRRQAAAQSEELRRLADEAEAKSRAHAAIPEPGKKKGFLARSGKKKDQKEGERLAQDAKIKKDKLLEAQSHLNDAQSLASDTKAEADRLRKEVEDSEIKVASAASMQKQAPPTNGYPRKTDPSPYGMGTLPSYGMDYSKPPPMTSDVGDSFGEPLGGHQGQGFDSSVMGNSGFSIPAPPSNDTGVMVGSGGASIPDLPVNAADDPYSNPF